MSQKTDLLKLFRANGNQLTLGQIMGTTLAREHSARMRDLRKEGYVIICEDKDREHPSNNLYRLIETSPDCITAVLSDPAEKQDNTLKGDSKPKEPEPRAWRQANIACLVCGSWYQVKIGNNWVCNRENSHRERLI